MTSKASPATGTSPTTPSTATLPSIRAVMYQGAPSAPRLPHQPQRNRRRDDVSNDRDQADQPVDAVADLGAGNDEGDVQELCDGIEPRQPLLAGKVGKRIGARLPEIESQSLELLTQAGIGDLPPFLVDHRAAPCGAAPGRLLGAWPRRRIDIVVHGHHMVTRMRGASCVKSSRRNRYCFARAAVALQRRPHLMPARPDWPGAPRLTGFS